VVEWFIPTRLLRLAYDDPTIIAAKKIIGALGSYNSSNLNHVFAVLSTCLYLDINIANAQAVPLAHTAVNTYMRLVKSVDLSIRVMYTRIPSEPILAKAAMGYLCRGALSLKKFLSGPQAFRRQSAPTPLNRLA
jgi:hypothetical protein